MTAGRCRAAIVAAGLGGLAACSAEGGEPESLQVVERPGSSDVPDPPEGPAPATGAEGESPSRPAPTPTPELPPEASSPVCTPQQLDLEAPKAPVDIVVVVDNSNGMEEEVEAFEANVNGNFAAVLQEAGVDFRLILLSEHAERDSDDTALCIEAPLSGQAVCTADEPVFSERFFQYSTSVGSENSLELLLETFAPPLRRDDDFDMAPDGWSAWLRPGASTVFLEVTDDDSDLSASEFLEELTALSPDRFGTTETPRFVFHSVVGVAERGPGELAYPPQDPLQEDECESNGGDVDNAGEEYQELSRITGGLRFAVCQFDAFDAVLQGVADEVAQLSQAGCQFELPPLDSSIAFDPLLASVRRVGPGGEPTALSPIDDPARCTAESYSLSGTTLTLCPEACAAASDASSRIELSLGCGGP